jgi:hypothetical protein
MVCPESYAHHPVESVSRDEANSLSPYWEFALLGYQIPKEIAVDQDA